MTIGRDNIMCLGSQRRCGPKRMIGGTFNSTLHTWKAWCPYCDTAVLVRDHRFTDHRKDGTPIDGDTIHRGKSNTARNTGWVQPEFDLAEPKPEDEPPF